MVVPGIISALDIAPTLHFVEPGLKINVEEWIKVTDEYIAPNRAALMEPGRTLVLLLDSAPSHACRLAFDHNKTVMHGKAEFQPPCTPVVFGATSSRHSSFSVQLLPIPQTCGHF